MRTITKLRRSTRGLSPIFATLILIAIAVIAGIVVYMFTSGTIATLTGGGSAGQEKIAVQSAVYSAGRVQLWVQQTGGSAATPAGVMVRDASGNTVATATSFSYPTTVVPLAQGALTELNVTLSLGSGTYTAILSTKAGGSFNSPSFTVG